MEGNGQGSLEYLLIISAALVVAVIVIAAIVGIGSSTSPDTEGVISQYDKLKCLENCSYDSPTSDSNCEVINPDACRHVCSPRQELCYGGIDEDCDGLTDCGDAEDCPDSNPMCGSPLAILAIAGGIQDEGGPAATPEETEVGWDPVIDLVVSNRGSLPITITEVIFTGTTNCHGCESSYCACDSSMQTASNTVADSATISNPRTEWCSSGTEELNAVFNPAFSAGRTPWETTITGGDVNLFSACTQEKPPITVKPGEQVGLTAALIWPDWCLRGSGKNLDVTIVFSPADTQSFNDVTIPCTSTESYLGSFSYIKSLGFGQFPAPWWPLVILVQSSSSGYYNSTSNTSQMHAAPAGDDSINYLNLKIANWGTTSVTGLSQIKVIGSKVTGGDYTQSYAPVAIAPGQVASLNIANTTPDVYTITDCAQRTDLNIQMFYDGTWYPTSIAGLSAQKGFTGCLRP